MDAVSSARTARENLARGLAALQGPGVPPQLIAAADPVAQAMGHLHRIESTGGAAIAESAPAALSLIRQALAMLQTQPLQHPAVDQGMEAIAGSLGIVHQLTQIPASAMQPVSPYAGTMMMDQAQVAAPASAGPATRPSTNMPYPPQPERPPQVQVARPGAAPATAAQPAHAASPRATGPGSPYATQPAAYAPNAQQPPAPAYAAPSANGVQRVEAALGAHSPTNFYKGLSGNDIIESGGLFIATYQILPIGTPVLIHVSLPGGYEFEAQAVVRWTREMPHSAPGGHESPPGFGAQFTQISPEGRQLVYRYVRNREPLFHDDL